MIQKYRNKIKKSIEEYCETNYEKINRDNMRLGRGLFNHRCQHNAVQQVKEGLMEEVYMVVCISGSEYPVVHFINKDNEGFYIDNTLGYLYDVYDSYIIRKIDPSEFNKMNDLLMNTKKSLITIHSSKFLNKILRINEHNLGI